MVRSLEFFRFENCNKCLIAKWNFFQAVKSYLISSLAKSFNRRLRSLRTLLRRHCIMGQTSFPRLWRFISIKYLPFGVKMGKCVFSDKWKANERFKTWIADDPKSRTKAKYTVCDKAINILSMGDNVQRFFTNFFRGVFGQAQHYFDWLCCVALCCVFLFLLFCCVVLCCVVICLLFVSLGCWLKISQFSCTFIAQLDATSRRTADNRFDQLNQFDNGSTNSTTQATSGDPKILVQFSCWVGWLRR